MTGNGRKRGLTEINASECGQDHASRTSKNLAFPPRVVDLRRGRARERCLAGSRLGPNQFCPAERIRQSAIWDLLQRREVGAHTVSNSPETSETRVNTEIVIVD
jgi:hypothetical protein